MTEKKAIREAVEKAGGYTALARELDLTRHHIWNWANVEGVGVPAKYVLAIEAATGVSRHDLKPEVFGPRVPQRNKKSA